jgi:MscS family membrane protein
MLLTIGIFARKLFTKSVLYLIKKFSGQLHPTIKEKYLVALMKPLSLIFVIGAFYVAGIVADLPPKFANFFHNLMQTLISFAIFWGIFSVVVVLNNISKNRRDDKINDEIKDFFARIIEILIIVVGIIAVMQIWGIDVGAFLAGLGILGMAIGFAAQDTIKNFFGCIALLMDKTFQKGHWIKTSLVEGYIENIGFRTTAIRQLDKALVHIPNAKLADDAVINFTKMTYRRVKWTLELSYNTSTQGLERITQRIRLYLDQHPGVETDPKKATTIVHYDDFTSSAIVLLCSFFTKSTGSKDYMDVKEECLLAFKRIVEEESSFSYPARILQVDSIVVREAL